MFGLRIKPQRRALAFVLGGVLTVVGCGAPGSSPSTAAGTAPPASSAESSSPPASPANVVELFKDTTPAEGAAQVDTAGFRKDGPYTIGFSDISLANSWRVQARKSAEIIAQELGVELKVTDAGGDANKQIADVESLLGQGIDALVITPTSSEALGPVIERAADSGIPVIVWSSAPGTEKYTSRVFVEDVDFGVAGMEQLAKDMGGKGKLIALRGIAGISVETDRYNGMVEVLKKYPDIELVGEDYGDWAEDKGKAVAQNLLAAHPQIDGVWSSGAAMTKGAIAAFQEADRPLVPMSGEHLNGFLKLWKELGLKSVGPVYPSWQGAEAVKLAALALQGQPIARDYLLTPAPITNADLDAAVKPDLSDDYWVEGYLTDEQLKQLFP